MSTFFCILFLLPLLALAEEDAPEASPSGTKVISASSATLEEDGKTVAVGNIDVLDFDFQPRVTIGNQQYLKAEQGTNLRQVRLIPLKKGTTSVVIDDEKGRTVRKIIYNIITNDLSQKVISIRRLLLDIEGISIESVDDKIVIDGELIVPRDFDRILQVQQAYPEVLNLVTLSKISREALARRMQREINDDPSGVNVQVKIINDTFFLLGKVDSSPDKERAETIAQTYLPETVGSTAVKDGVLIQGAKKFSIRNLVVVDEAPPAPPPKMVRITYHFVEIGKEFLKASFFKWMPLVTEGSGLQFGQSTTGGVASSSNGSFAGIITNLLPRLQSGANGGFARVLFSTVMIGKDNTDIELLRGDQVPYISAIVNGVPVPENVDVNISVKVRPEIQGEDKISLQNTFQYSALSGAGAGGKPRVTKTSVNNQVIVKSGESAALGGLISNNTSKDIDKDPESAGTQTGGPIFTLLRSKAFRNNKTQFVVFITPKIITDAAEGTADIKSKILNNNKKRKRVVK